MPGININEVISRPGAERAILSIILSNRDRIVDCESANLFSEHFSVEANRHLYSVICYLSSSPDVQNIDSLLIYNTITDPNVKAKVDEIGGLSYIDTLIQSRVANNLGVYIKQVRSCALKRIAYHMGEDIQQLILNTSLDSDPEELLNTIQTMTLDLVLNSEQAEEVYRMGDDTSERLRRRRENPNSVPGYSVGWRNYDRITQGYKSNELTVYVAESKTGKSTLLLNHSIQMSIIDGIPGLYIDTEMNDVQQEDRTIANLSGVPYEEIFNGMYAQDTEYGTAEDKIRRVDAAVVQLQRSNLYHIYMPNFTIEKVTALVRKYKLQHNIGFVIFDYIKLPTSEIAGLANSQEYQRLGFITTCLKDIAGICDIPVITAAQSNRSSLGSTNQDANNIGGSYRILQMADRLCFLRNKTDFEIAQEGLAAGNQKLNVKYQRNGSSDNAEINICFNKATLKMWEAA